MSGDPFRGPLDVGTWGSDQPRPVTAASGGDRHQPGSCLITAPGLCENAAHDHTTWPPMHPAPGADRCTCGHGPAAHPTPTDCIRCTCVDWQPTSGADQPTPDEYAGHVGSCRMFYAERRCTCGANLTDEEKAAVRAQVLNARVTFADQPTLPDQIAGLDVLRLMHASLPHDPRAGDPAFCAEDGKPWPCPTYEALPVIEADRERAKAEGGAEALEGWARAFGIAESFGARRWRLVHAAAARALSDDAAERRAALRGSTGGGTC